jgi:hypothetical protein
LLHRSTSSAVCDRRQHGRNIFPSDFLGTHVRIRAKMSANAPSASLLPLAQQEILHLPHSCRCSHSGWLCQNPRITHGGNLGRSKSTERVKMRNEQYCRIQSRIGQLLDSGLEKLARLQNCGSCRLFPHSTAVHSRFDPSGCNNLPRRVRCLASILLKMHSLFPTVGYIGLAGFGHCRKYAIICRCIRLSEFYQTRTIRMLHSDSPLRVIPGCVGDIISLQHMRQ